MFFILFYFPLREYFFVRREYFFVSETKIEPDLRLGTVVN